MHVFLQPSSRLSRDCTQGQSGQLVSLEKGTLSMNWNADETAFDRGNAFTCT